MAAMSELLIAEESMVAMPRVVDKENGFSYLFRAL